MSSKPNKNSSESERLPFEPTKSRKKPEKQPDKKPAPAPVSKALSGSKPRSQSSASIPEAVSRRMIKRMAIFSGIPTFLGVSSFFVSYYVVSHSLFKLPNTAVLFVSLGFFGLGVVGLSYGALSSSWDEDSAGGWVGWKEFTTNLGRMQQAWREAREQSKPTR